MYRGTKDVACGAYSYSIENSLQLRSTLADPTSEVICYPRHPPPHDNPENDMLIKLARLDPWEGCRQKHKYFQCHGCSSSSQESPISNNAYQAFYFREDNATLECDISLDTVVEPNGNLDEESVRLCAVPFEKVIETCPWTGGEVRNACGRFVLQSCPRAYYGACRIGSPLGN